MTTLNGYIDIGSGPIGAPYRLTRVPRYDPSATRAISNPHVPEVPLLPYLYLHSLNVHVKYLVIPNYSS